MATRSTKSSTRRDPVRVIQDVFGVDLRQFQRDWLTELFREEEGRRVYTRALWGQPRGNGKSHMAAAVAGYMLLSDKPRDGRPPQVVIAAGSWQQGMITFKRLREFIENSPLAKIVDVLSGRGFMRIKGGAELFVVSAEGPLQHGLEPTAVFFDEVWNQTKSELYDALLGGMVKRPEPLMVMISTAGFDEDSLLAQLRREGEAGDNPRFFYQWHAAPDEADWQDPATWKLANPAMGCERPFLTPESLMDSFRSMHENEFRRWHLNQWTAAEDTFITAEIWDQCAEPPIIEPLRPTVLGVDAAITQDAAAVATVQLDDSDVFNAEFKIWEPKPNQNIRLEDIADHIRQRCRELNVVGVAYDKMFMGHASQMLEEEGIRMIEWPQNNQHMCPSTRTLYEAVTQKKLRHGGDKLARSHALAAAVRETERGLRIKKTASRAPDDSCVALAMAVEVASRKVSPRQSVYSTREPVAV